MPRKRLPVNSGLPKGWRFLHGAYYYQVPKGQEHAWDERKLFPLGKTLAVAYKVWADRIGVIDNLTSIGALLDKYTAEVVPTKAPATRTTYTKRIKRLKETFADVSITALKPMDIYKYHTVRKSKTNARQEIAVLSHAFTMAVKWGFIERHPFKGEVRLEASKPRTRYVEDWEFRAAMSLSPMRKTGSVLMIQAYLLIKDLTGMRQRDMLLLQESDLTERGILVTPSKTASATGKSVIYEWTDALHAAVQVARLARPVDTSAYLFCNKYGECYVDAAKGIASGWDSMWQRFMTRLLKETEIKARFTEHDLRAKVASDAESDEMAQKLLAHANINTTRRFYRRKPEVLKPAR